MKPFMDADFLLNSETARELYHEYAEGMPIFDYHCHLPPREIAEDQRFENLGRIWLGGDHYKWRAMRSNGIEERCITGDASWAEKFRKWAETVPRTIGNPLYHWTHLELQRYFGIDTLLGPDTADMIWTEANEQIAAPDFSVRNLLTRMNVRYVGTTDDPVDDLRYHKALGGSDFPVVVRPSFRPDKAYSLGDPAAFREWIGTLAAAANMESIETFEHLREALRRRITFFAEAGCTVSDHALVLPVNTEYTEGLLNGVLTSVLRGGVASKADTDAFTTAVLEFVAREYAERGWVFQLHIGALRNNNTRMYRALGPDSGFDSIVDGPIAENLSGFLDRLDRDNALPRTILYGLNPGDNELLATMLGNFQDGTVPGKIQHGSGWWFNDQKDGMIRQMVSLANLGLLSRFVGMLTDSRSFLSFPRHEYFRRILSDLIGGWVEAGEAPREMKLLGGIVQDICWYNAHDYFGIDAVPREV
ncbi:MAG: glucuronate isomerase [Alkalispirochaeta sp.]